ERYGDYVGMLNDPLAFDSLNYLLRVWPHLIYPDSPWSVKAPPGRDFIDWNGNGKADGPVILEGDQCLVFFLAGIPRQGAEPACLGFSTDPRDPAKLGQVKDRKGPFFAFDGKRLITRPESTHFSYADRWGKGWPYAYFSNYGIRNGYNKYGPGDCAGLSIVNGPYTESLNRYYNPSTHQVISAG